MKVRLRGIKRIAITGEFIKLDALLKYANIASTGGEAKNLIQTGSIFVHEKACYERGKKIKPGDIVRCREGALLITQKETGK